ncbi:MAG: hypothetical protein GXP26_10610 [Planctomycetes bacterium]|nr:hypothetical protein [Planctomycetota bacterium]
MSESNLTEVYDALQEKLLSLYQKRRQLKGELQQVKDEQVSVRQALIKLGHKPEKPPKKKRKKFRPTVGFVTLIAEMHLRLGTLPEEYLKEEIKPLLTQRGFNFKGYAEVFREAMDSPQFRHDEHGNVTHVIEVCDDLLASDTTYEIEIGNSTAT